MRHLDLFSGIGGFALAAQRVWKEEYELLSFCERDKFCRKVLRKHWPDVPIINDIHHFNGGSYDSVNLVTAGYPCQGESKLGHRRGKEDDRWLWPQAFRVIRQSGPDWFIGENVANHYRLGLDQVLTDLESEGYTARPFGVPACSVGADHERERIWIVAHNNSKRVEGCSPQSLLWESGIPWYEDGGGSPDLRDRSYMSGRNLCRRSTGISQRVDALGNSIVPQVARVIMTAIKHIEERSLM